MTQRTEAQLDRKAMIQNSARAVLEALHRVEKVLSGMESATADELRREPPVALLVLMEELRGTRHLPENPADWSDSDNYLTKHAHAIQEFVGATGPELTRHADGSTSFQVHRPVDEVIVEAEIEETPHGKVYHVIKSVDGSVLQAEESLKRSKGLTPEEVAASEFLGVLIWDLVDIARCRCDLDIDVIQRRIANLRELIESDGGTAVENPRVDTIHGDRIELKRSPLSSDFAHDSGDRIGNAALARRACVRNDTCAAALKKALGRAGQAAPKGDTSGLFWTRRKLELAVSNLLDTPNQKSLKHAIYEFLSG